MKPLVSVATYSCDACGSEIYQQVAGPNFMPMFTCQSEICQQNKRRGRLTLQTRGSRFVRFQEIKIQEMVRGWHTYFILVIVAGNKKITT